MDAWISEQQRSALLILG